MEAGLTLREFLVMKEAGTLVQVATCEEKRGLVRIYPDYCTWARDWTKLETQADKRGTNGITAFVFDDA